MDNIPVRPLKFDASDSEPVWSQSSPEFAMFINALGVDVPHFERFLVRVMREYRGELSDQSCCKTYRPSLVRSLTTRSTFRSGHSGWRTNTPKLRAWMMPALRPLRA